MEAKIGIIGGSGLYHLFEEEDVQETLLETPFGAPSDHYFEGQLDNQPVVFLPRHGRSHSYLPTEVNYRANIYGMKMLGVTHILSIGAVGSLRKELKPRDVVIVDQFFDRTTKRPLTFFGEGLVAHVSFGDPVCEEFRGLLIDTCKKLEGTFHNAGTYVNMEGPQFSTRAESNYYRKQGFDVIGMTNMSEARLAREAEISYATLAFVTDYDCWHDEEDEVTTDAVLQVLHDNADNARQIVKAIIQAFHALPNKYFASHDALKQSIITPMDKVPVATQKKLKAILEKYTANTP